MQLRANLPLSWPVTIKTRNNRIQRRCSEESETNRQSPLVDTLSSAKAIDAGLPARTRRKGARATGFRHEEQVWYNRGQKTQEARRITESSIDLCLVTRMNVRNAIVSDALYRCPVQ
jgi:hypothetical protein